MAFGGGTFTVQNKVLPGTYINFVSATSANAALSDRGIATMPLELDWGIDGEVFEVTSEDFQKNSMGIFGYDYTHDKLKGLRDLFRNIRTLYVYKLTSRGAKAGNDLAEAVCGGIRGNDLKIIVQKDADDEELFVVKTVLGTVTVDEQVVSGADGLVPNRFVRFKSGAELMVTAAVPLSGGTNGTVDGTAHQTYLDKIESFSYNTMGVAVTDETTKGVYSAFVRRLREEMGVKFQLVLYNKAADYCGTVSVKNRVLDEGWGEAALVYWVTGILAGCEVNKSTQNRRYDGEFAVAADYTQGELKEAIRQGEFTLHKVGKEIRVLADINTMVTVTDTQGEVFKDNQTIRVIDQIGNDIAVMFNTKYLGVVPNDAAGRVSLWSDIVAHHRKMEGIRAIEGFSDADVSVEPGETKKSVVVKDYVTVVNAMGKLYMTVTVA